MNGAYSHVYTDTFECKNKLQNLQSIKVYQEKYLFQIYETTISWPITQEKGQDKKNWTILLMEIKVKRKTQILRMQKQTHFF